ncbi:MAG TPA: hypothetical protein VHL53_08700 [Acidimicrobiia bacterium]|nr:hypothetical protein [Acidimicrobiia bacterium]
MAPQQTIIVDHLARLEDGSVAVAGIDGNHEHIAPLRGSPWDTASTARGGGPFGIGEAVDLGFSRRVGTLPLVEEREVEENRVTALGRLSDGQFWSLLETLGHDHLPSIYGDELTVSASGAASIPVGRGKASLGVLRCPGPAELFRRGSQLRLGLDDLRLGSLDLNVYDFRLRDEKGVPIDSMWKVIRRRVQSGEPVILSVGLSPPFNGAHWLRVDNIHFRDYFDDHPVFRFARGRDGPR